MSFRYTMNPITVEAVQLSVLESNDTVAIPTWLMKAIMSGEIYETLDVTYVKTLEGSIEVTKDSYIIRGIQGELYPCKKDIFLATYTKEPEVA